MFLWNAGWLSTDCTAHCILDLYVLLSESKSQSCGRIGQAAYWGRTTSSSTNSSSGSARNARQMTTISLFTLVLRRGLR
jgi:hypothetical protein